RDLRGGAALVLAGLAARGDTVIENIGLIDRGYPRLEETIAALGGRMERMILSEQTEVQHVAAAAP
ncbi:MAG: hypothetical protein IJ662_01245, partial [Clostridia bacterium]|nr:hypothetical protein [Clostridia bacterium]